MDRTRDLPRGRFALRAALTAVKVGVLAVLVVGPTAGVVPSAAPEPDRLGSGCSQQSLDEDGPGRALIRTDQGRIRQVSFHVAWDVYNGRRPGTVLAVCVPGPGR
jgi:hypothetical protein